MPALFRNRTFQHALFWLWGSGVMYASMSVGPDSPMGAGVVVPRILVHLAGYAIAVYLNLRLLIPRYLRPKRYASYAGLLVVAIGLGSGFVHAMYGLWLGDLMHGPDRPQWDRPWPVVGIIVGMQTFIFVVLTSLLHLVKEWIALRERNLRWQELEKEKVAAELKTLKDQLNPHFLFNALNNIYALSLDKSDQCPEAILKLSELMRHILYECGDPLVPLRKEIDFVHNYLDLERVRTNGAVRIDFQTSGYLGDQAIAPLLFMPFIENAFKHGLKNQLDDAYVDVRLHLESPTRLHFAVENNKQEGVREERRQPGGIGLDNVGKRLAMLYPDSHQLDIESDDERFRVALRLDLDGARAADGAV